MLRRVAEVCRGTAMQQSAAAAWGGIQVRPPHPPPRPPKKRLHSGRTGSGGGVVRIFGRIITGTSLCAIDGVGLAPASP